MCVLSVLPVFAAAAAAGSGQESHACSVYDLCSSDVIYSSEEIAQI